MSPPLVSVVVPTTGRARLLARAVESALGQRDVELEVIVVADAPAETGERIEGLLPHADDRVRVIAPGSLGSVAAARNHGIAAARGGWIAFLDDDDFWAPDKLARQLAEAERSGADFVYTATIVVDEDLRPIRIREAPDPGSLGRALLHTNAIGSPSSVLVRARLLDGAGFDERFSILADWDLWLRLIRSVSPAACEQPLVAYLYHDDNMHLRRGTASLLAEFRALARLHRERAGDGPLRAGPLLLWLSERHRGAGHRVRHAALRGLAAILEPGFRPSREEVRRRLRRRDLPSTMPPPARPEWFRPYLEEAESRRPPGR